MDDKIEATQERVEECRMLINELLKEYNCSIECSVLDGSIYVCNDDASPPYYDVKL